MAAHPIDWNERLIGTSDLWHTASFIERHVDATSSAVAGSDVYFEGSATMPMMTGAQYKESLKDGRLTYIDGDQVTDPAKPSVAENRRRRRRTRLRQLLFRGSLRLHTRPSVIPRSIDEYRDRAHRLSQGVTDMTLGTTGVTLLALTSAAAKLGEVNPAYSDRIYAYVEYCKKHDLRCAEVITDSKEHRTSWPNKQSDPDFYVHVVDRNADGVFITGGEAAHQRVVDRTRTGDHADESDVSRRRGLRHRMCRAGECARRLDHRHDVRAARRGRSPLSR